MQTSTASTSQGGGNLFAFLFGAIFNLVANNGNESFFGYTIKVIVYVCIYFLAKILADIYSEYRDRDRNHRSDKSKKQSKKKRDRHD